MTQPASLLNWQDSMILSTSHWGPILDQSRYDTPKKVHSAMLQVKTEAMQLDKPSKSDKAMKEQNAMATSCSMERESGRSWTPEAQYGKSTYQPHDPLSFCSQPALVDMQPTNNLSLPLTLSHSAKNTMLHGFGDTLHLASQSSRCDTYRLGMRTGDNDTTATPRLEADLPCSAEKDAHDTVVPVDLPALRSPTKNTTLGHFSARDFADLRNKFEQGRHSSSFPTPLHHHHYHTLPSHDNMARRRRVCSTAERWVQDPIMAPSGMMSNQTLTGSCPPPDEKQFFQKPNKKEDQPMCAALHSLPPLSPNYPSISTRSNAEDANFATRLPMSKVYRNSLATQAIPPSSLGMMGDNRTPKESLVDPLENENTFALSPQPDSSMQNNRSCRIARHGRSGEFTLPPLSSRPQPSSLPRSRRQWTWPGRGHRQRFHTHPADTDNHSSRHSASIQHFQPLSNDDTMTTLPVAKACPTLKPSTRIPVMTRSHKVAPTNDANVSPWSSLAQHEKETANNTLTLEGNKDGHRPVASRARRPCVWPRKTMRDIPSKRFHSETTGTASALLISAQAVISSPDPSRRSSCFEQLHQIVTSHTPETNFVTTEKPLIRRKIPVRADDRKRDEDTPEGDGKGAMSPQRARELYRDQLTPFERNEINEFTHIYFVGPDAQKRPGGSRWTTLNNGFDDDRGDYRVVMRDHLGYRYEALQMLGKGSFGQVVKCVDHKTGEMVAVKIIRNKKRFQAQAWVETKTLEDILQWDAMDQHHLVHMSDHFYFRNHLCIVFECLSANLYDVLKNNQFRGFSLGLIRRFACQLLKAMSLLHEHKLIHCDLKPENILLKYPTKSTIKVIDFGSSCLEFERVYTYIQSRFYRAPEVILGIDYTTAIDMWSLGCILAELYTGQPLFAGESERDQLACMMEILGLPDFHLIDKSPRKSAFFDVQGNPRIMPNAKGRRRRPGTKNLEQVLACTDDPFVDFLRQCLHWRPDRRLTAQDALQHVWILKSSHHAQKS